MAWKLPFGIRLGWGKSVRAKYDAAQTTNNNRRWWALADGLSAAKANNPTVRKKIRERSRYETANNCYAMSAVTILANAAIGSGPRLQIDGFTEADATQIESAFHSWAQATGLAEKLRIMRRAKAVDGEVFAVMSTNRAVPHPVKLDIQLYETEQIAAGSDADDAEKLSDGIRRDEFGNPISYNLLNVHPGTGMATGSTAIPAESMIHYAHITRPGQVRGVSELTPALGLFGQLRAFTNATIAAAEKIANFAAVAYTEELGDDERADDVTPLESIEIENGMMTSLPRGWKLGQVKPEQPATTYGEFKNQIVTEVGRAMEIPFILLSGNSGDSSYASGRLDFQFFDKNTDVDRKKIERDALDRIFFEWLKEAIRVSDLLPASADIIKSNWSHSWFWDGREHVDPAKEATALERLLERNATTLSEWYGSRGKDWEAQLQQRKREVEKEREYGILPASKKSDQNQASDGADGQGDKSASKSKQEAA